MLAPKLRFKDDNGREFAEWRTVDLIDIVKDRKLSNGVFNDPKLVGKGYKLINVINMFGNKNINEDNLSLVNIDQAVFEKNKVTNGDIFFTRSSLAAEGIAVSNIYLGSSKNITYDGHLIKITPDKSKINSIFLYFLLKTTTIRKQIVQRGKTTTMTTIGQDDLATVNIDYPCIEEQTKIANFLTTLDTLINQQEKQCQLLEQYKKGMMQQLFSQKLRFKDDDGEEFPKWGKLKLLDLFDFYRGSPLSKLDLNNKGKNLCIHYGELFTKYNEITNMIHSKTFLENGFLSKKYDILLPSSDVTPDGLARATCLLIDNVILGGDINVLRPKNSKNINSIFFAYLLTFQKNKIIKIVTGTTVKHLYNSELKSLEYKVSLSIEEQTKIAHFLSTLDDKITLAKQQLEQLNTYKKGLLQQLFI